MSSNMIKLVELIYTLKEKTNLDVIFFNYDIDSVEGYIYKRRFTLEYKDDRYIRIIGREGDEEYLYILSREIAKYIGIPDIFYNLSIKGRKRPIIDWYLIDKERYINEVLNNTLYTEASCLDVRILNCNLVEEKEEVKIVKKNKKVRNS